jgi:histone H3/H4
MSASVSKEVLVVVSKLKQYIKQRGGMNTSEAVSGVLSDHLRHLCDQAIARAAEEGRKTVMDRDFEPFMDLQ